MQIEEAKKILSDEITALNVGHEKYEKAVETLIYYIEMMHSELDRLEGIEDNTAMLKYEVEKKEAEIYKLRNTNKDLLKKLRNRVKEVKKLTRYSLYKKEFATLNKQLEKKNKVIDKMAEKLVEAHGWFYSEFDNYTKEDWKEYFYKRVGEEYDAIGR